MNLNTFDVVGLVLGFFLLLTVYLTETGVLKALTLPTARPTIDMSHATTTPLYTVSDVALHADSASCWSTINGGVYDLTSWIDEHPGGADAILALCGKDGSPAFEYQHEGESRPEALLASFRVGTLRE